MIGQRVGPYEVIGRLGAGGMGEVYRARDTKLGRDVALKFLPETLASDSDRLMRFDREARTLASLNHPNIAHIHGLEDAGSTRALVMELVEGEDLAARIARGPMPLDDALPIARQIAEALEAAHEIGIIHRDLKPANIKVRPDGTVKVLDFGLAKAVELGVGSGEPGVGSTLANSPTITSPALTMRGVILGTAAYMAPEQAKGRPVDKRADIWAFGCVLYEMLTGRRAFDGEDVTDTLAAVVTREPDWTQLPASTPPALVRLLRRALVKDRRNRLPDIAAARLDIDEAREPVTTIAGSAMEARPARSRVLPWAVVTFAAAAAAAAAVSFLLRPPASTATPVYQSSLTVPHNLNGRAPAARMALSPDGTRLAYVAMEGADGRPHLYVRLLSGATAQRLPGTEGAIAPFWSPDSRWVAFFADTQLKKVDVGGGPPVAVCELPQQSGSVQQLPGAWSADGMIVISNGPLLRVPAAGGIPEPITTVDTSAGETGHSYPQALPDGRVLFTAYKGIDPLAIYVARPGAASRQKVMDGGSNAHLASGALVYLRGPSLVAQAFDAATATVSGSPVPLAEPVLPNLTVPRGGAFTVSQTGALVYQTALGFGGVRLVWVDRAGRQTPVVEESATYRDLSLSRDGNRLAFIPLDERGRSDVWRLDLDRGVRSRLTFAGREQSVTWSPDGRQIIFNSVSGNEAGLDLDLYRKSADGSGSDELLLADDRPKWPLTWSSDGRYLLFDRFDPSTSNDIWLLALDGSRPPAPLLAGPFSERWAQFSPDGQWIAYTTDEAGRREVFLMRFPGTGERWQVSTAGGSYPRWRHDGRELYFLSNAGKIVAVPVSIRGGAPDFGASVPLFDARAPDGFGRYFYDVAPDGRFLMSVPGSSVQTFELTLLVNWPSLLADAGR